MKHLIVSLKTSNEMFGDFKRAFRTAKAARKRKEPHFEISFDDKKDFDRFIRNLPVLKFVVVFRPKSVYELAKLARMDVSNLNKVILFFEEIGALKVRTEKVSGRTVRKPVVDYDTVEFSLAA